jgi:TRAP-type C4-dicarboxylate transport system substrate-binding protein
MLSKRGVAAAGAAALLVAAAQNASAQKLDLNYSQWIPAAHWSQVHVLHEYFKEVSEATGGRVNILPTAKGLGAPARQHQLVVDGIADLSWVVHGYTPGVFPLSHMAELPFITESGEANSVAYWRTFEKYFRPAGMHEGMYTLALIVHPPGHVHNNKKEIKSLADFEGLKLRTPTSTVAEAYGMLGAIPISAPITELREGMARGVIDGTSAVQEALYAFNLANHVKYTTIIPGGIYSSSITVPINQKKWDGISAADREAISKLSGEVLSRRLGKYWDDEEKGAPPKLLADGVRITRLEGEVLNQMKAKLGLFEERWIAEANKAGVDGKAAIQYFREQIKASGS